MDIEVSFCDVDSDNDLSHGFPSLRIRAHSAHATVRATATRCRKRNRQGGKTQGRATGPACQEADTRAADWPAHGGLSVSLGKPAGSPPTTSSRAQTRRAFPEGRLLLEIPISPGLGALAAFGPVMATRLRAQIASAAVSMEAPSARRGPRQAAPGMFEK